MQLLPIITQSLVRHFVYSYEQCDLIAKAFGDPDIWR